MHVCTLMKINHISSLLTNLNFNISDDSQKFSFILRDRDVIAHELKNSHKSFKFRSLSNVVDALKEALSLDSNSSSYIEEIEKVFGLHHGFVPHEFSYEQYKIYTGEIIGAAEVDNLLADTHQEGDDRWDAALEISAQVRSYFLES